MKCIKILAMMAMAVTISIFAGVTVAAQEAKEGILVTEDGTHLFYEETQSDTGEFVWGIYGVYSDTNVIRIPETIEGKKVYELYPDALYASGNETVEEIYLPENMKVVPCEDEFRFCPNLRKIHLGGVQKISGRWSNEMDLFYCSNLESFSTGDSANFPIEADSQRQFNMFGDNIINNLKYIRIGSSMENVAKEFFYGSSLEWVDIGDNNPLYSGSNGVVYSADGKTLLVCGTAYPESFYEIPEGVEETTSIGFSDCKNIKKIKVPSTVEKGPLNWSGTSGITLQVEKYSYAYFYALQTGMAYELYGAPQPHTHRYETVVDQAATCGAPGRQHEVCVDCLEIGESAVIPATGAHTYGEYITVVPPTSSETGTALRTCSICGASETKVLDKLPQQTEEQKQDEEQNSGTQESEQNSWNNAHPGNSGSGNGKEVYPEEDNGADTKDYISKDENVFGLKKQISVTAGKSISLKPKTGTNGVTYRSSNKKIAIVTQNGILKGLKTGSAIITVQSGNVKTDIIVKVTAPAVKKITNVPKKKTLKKGKSFTIKPKLSPKGSKGKIMFSSSNKKVAKVTAKGKVIAKKKGTAVITVKVGKLKVKCKVTVK